MTTKKLSNNQLKVKIAKDALKLLQLIKLNHSYLSVDRQTFDEDGNSVLIPELIDYIAKDCSVCILGACLLAFIKNDIKNDDFFVEELGSGEEIIDLLEFVFARQELMLMEYIYEQGKQGVLIWEISAEGEEPLISIQGINNGLTSNLTYQIQQLGFEVEQLKRALIFSKKYKSDKSRFTAIMNNIIKNKGVLKI